MSEPRRPDSDVEKIAVMREMGMPFDLAAALSIVDWEEVHNDLVTRQLTGQVTADYQRPIERLAIVALAYYAPHRLGIDVDELEHPAEEPLSDELWAMPSEGETSDA